MAFDHGQRPWPSAMAKGHGLQPWPKAMAFGHGLWPWPPAMAISSPGGFSQGETPFQKLTFFLDMLILVYFSSFPYATIIPSVSVTKGRKEFEVARFSAQPKSSSIYIYIYMFLGLRL